MAKVLVQCESVPAYLSEDQAREVDELVKTLPQDCKYIRKAMPVDITFEKGEHSEVSIINTDSVDREGEVILPQGIQMDAYRKSGVVLWNHDHNKPVAKCVWVKLFHDEIRAKTNYDLPDETPDCDFKHFVTDVWAMLLAGVLKGKSVGLLPLTPRREPTAEELTAHPEWEGAGIRDSTILLEYSLCSIGVNQDCLVEQINNKSISPSRLVEFGIEIPTQKAVIKLPRIQSREEIIAAVLPFIRTKAVKKPKANKPIDINALIAKALDEIDPATVMRRAQQMYANRGKV